MSKLDFSDLGEDFSEDLVEAKSTHAEEGIMGQTKSEIAGAMFESKCPVIAALSLKFLDVQVNSAVA